MAARRRRRPRHALPAAPPARHDRGRGPTGNWCGGLLPLAPLPPSARPLIALAPISHRECLTLTAAPSSRERSQSLQVSPLPCPQIPLLRMSCPLAPYPRSTRAGSRPQPLIHRHVPSHGLSISERGSVSSDASRVFVKSDWRRTARENSSL